MREELMWIGWVSGSTLLQGTSVVMSVFIFNGTSGRGRFVRKLYRMGMEFSYKGFRSLGMGNVNSPTHTQESWVDSNLCTLELFAQFTVLLL
eukprot:1161842-Pelagomonas_calceolata.AAC.5